MKLASMIFLLILISCKEEKGPIDVPGIVYQMEGMQEPLGLTETYNKDGYILTGWYSDNNNIGVAIFMRIDKDGNLKKYKVLPNLYAVSKIYRDLQNPNDYVVVMTGAGIAKVDSNFNIKWKVNRVLISAEYITDVLDTIGGNYVIVGGDEAGKKLLVWKITPNGEVIDSFIYQFDEFPYGDAVIEVSNNTILVGAGDYERIDTNNYIFQILLIKLNENLDTLWTKRITLNEMFQGAGLRKPVGLMRTNDGGYILFSAYWTKDNIGYKPLTSVAMKLDGNGNVIKVRIFDESEFRLENEERILQGGHAFFKLKDGTNMAVLATTHFFPNLIWRFDDNLNTYCIKEYPLIPGYGVLYEDSNGSIVYVTSQSITDYLNDIIFTKLDKDCNILIWSKVYPNE